jgi:hypothetical protein
MRVSLPKPARVAPARRATARCRAVAVAAGAASPELAALSGCTVLAASSGEQTSADSLVSPQGVSLLLLFTQFGDFDSFELAQRLVDALPALDAAGVRVAAVGVGSPSAARRFCALTNWPAERLHADPSGTSHAALGLVPGAGRPGGALADTPLAAASGGVKLLAMCAGLGSPGTLTEVFRGYMVRRGSCWLQAVGRPGHFRGPAPLTRAPLVPSAGRPRRAARI